MRLAVPSGPGDRPVAHSSVVSHTESARAASNSDVSMYCPRPVVPRPMIAARITARYSEDGYLLSKAVVPAQEVELGVLRIRVIEGHLENIIFEGRVDGPTALLETYARKITESQPLRSDVLERYILLMNDLPGLSAERRLVPVGLAVFPHVHPAPRLACPSPAVTSTIGRPSSPCSRGFPSARSRSTWRSSPIRCRSSCACS